MNENEKNNIIIKSWEIIKNDSKIKKYYFIPWLISMIFLTVILVYQVIYTYVELFNKKDKILSIILNLFHSSYFLEIVILWAIFFLIYIIIMPIFEWRLISYISNKKTEENTSIEYSIQKWIYNFLPFFEYSNLSSQFKFISMLNIYLFCLRFIWVDYLTFLNYIFIFLLIISSIINILFAYSKFEIILNNKKAFEAISSSIKLSVINLALTTKIYFFLFLVNIRIIINFLVFLLFPIIIVSSITYITSKIFLFITIIFLGIVFLFFILILWYLWWVFEIFKTSVWYFTYQKANENIKKLEKTE